MTPTEEQITALETAAKAATKGEWKLDHDDTFITADACDTEVCQPAWIVEYPDDELENEPACAIEQHRANCRFISQANPATILALLADYRRLREALQVCVNKLSYPSCEAITHDRRCVDYDPAGSTYETTEREWFTKAKSALVPPEDQL